MLDINVPAYKLRDENIFNYRAREWQADVIENITKMLRCGERFGLRITSISIEEPEKKDLYELKRTNYKVLKIQLSVGDKELELTYDVPWLIDNHFYIGGNYKVPIFQLFDKPLINRNKTIKLRTNIYSFMVDKGNVSRRRLYAYNISMLGKKVPLAKIAIAQHGVEGIRTKFNLNETNDFVGSERLGDDMQILTDDVRRVLNDDTLDHTRLLGDQFPRRNDADIVEDLKLVTEIDIFSREFMETDNVIDEIIHYVSHGATDDCNYANKRIRFTEYVIYVHLCKDFFNMLSTVRKGRRIKFSNNTKAILTNVNQSSITQFDFSLNPLAELALLSRTSLSGPGGFEKTNVPAYLRDLHPSMIGKVGPSDTADRDGCGTIQYLTPTVELTNMGEMIAHGEDVINSVSISHVPFLEHNDQTRMQMSSSQQRHSIMLKKFDMPLIQSGVEGMYTDQTSFLFKAKRDGDVIHMDDDIIIIQYDNKTCEAYNIGYRKLYLSVADFYNIYFKNGDKFKRGDIIAESNYLSKGRLTIGKNLLTAIMVWYGYNFEDGIIVSEKIVEEDKFTSVHYVDLSFELPPNKILQNLNDDYADYKPLPVAFDRLQKGDIYGKIRTVFSEGFHDVIFEPTTELIVPEDCIITEVKMYANKWDKSFPQFDNYIKELNDAQKTKKTDLIDTLSKHLTKDELNKFMATMEVSKTEKTKSNYKIKGDSVDGIRIEITAMYERKLTVGDKLGNRHGNKGIVSAIIPEDKMPTLPDGRKAEIIINPLGILSRMNPGQVFETHLAMSLMDLKRLIKEKHDDMFEKKMDTVAVQSEIYNYLVDYYNFSKQPKALHFTDGGPWHQDYTKTSYAQNWLNYLTPEEALDHKNGAFWGALTLQ